MEYTDLDLKRFTLPPGQFQTETGVMRLRRPPGDKLLLDGVSLSSRAGREQSVQDSNLKS